MQAWRWTRNNHAFTHLGPWCSAVLLSMRRQVGAVLVTSGMMLALYVLYQWSAWLLLAAIVAITCITTLRLLFEEPRTVYAEQPLVVSLDEELPQTIPALEFPDTPMPSTPLVRVLETIDLSSSDIEHFIRSTAEYTSEQKTIDLPLKEEEIERSE